MKTVVANQIEALEKLCALPVSYRTLKRFCFAVFEQTCQILNIESDAVSLSFQRNPLAANGCMKCLKRKTYRFYVTVNLWHNLHEKYDDEFERYFYACATLCHELFHVYLQIQGSNNQFEDYMSFLAYTEVTGRFSRNYFYEIYAMVFLQDSPNSRGKKYFSSPEEICCIRYGYLTAYHLLKNTLNQHSRKKIGKILKSIELVYKSIEISYVRKSQPVSLLAKCYYRIISAASKNYNLLQQYPQFFLFIGENGIIRNLQGIYSAGKQAGIDFIGEIVVHFFMWETEDDLIHNPLSEEMYADIEQWANDYIEKSVEFLQNREKAEIILPKRIVEDNVALIIKNIALLNKRMMLLGMKHSGKNAVPLYRIS